VKTILWVASLFLISGCSLIFSSEDVGDAGDLLGFDAGPAADVAQANGALAEAGDLSLMPACEDLDGFFIDDAQADGDTLIVAVSHSGGCETHFYGACLEDNFVRIVHEDNDDFCEAIVSAELRIDLRRSFAITGTRDNGVEIE